MAYAREAGPLETFRIAWAQQALGDPKVNCATCQNGVYKPLFGAGMAQDFPELTGAPGQRAAAR
jgi:photosynthetic reaction center cytochrome c subunit